MLLGYPEVRVWPLVGLVVTPIRSSAFGFIHLSTITQPPYMHLWLIDSHFNLLSKYFHMVETTFDETNWKKQTNQRGKFHPVVKSVENVSLTRKTERKDGNPSNHVTIKTPKTHGVVNFQPFSHSFTFDINMISGLKSFGVFLTLIAVAHGASDQSAIYQKIQNDQCKLKPFKRIIVQCFWHSLWC